MNPQSRIKMRTPFWIIALGATAVFIILCCLGLVYVANHNMPNMVRNDYYEAGLHLDQQRGREMVFDSLHLRLSLTQEPDTLVLRGLGATLDSVTLNRLKSLNVKLVLQRPDDPSADREVVMQAEWSAAKNNLLVWKSPASLLRPGKWECQVLFESKDKPVMERSFTYFAGG